MLQISLFEHNSLCSVISSEMVLFFAVKYMLHHLLLC